MAVNIFALHSHIPPLIEDSHIANACINRAIEQNLSRIRDLIGEPAQFVWVVVSVFHSLETTRPNMQNIAATATTVTKRNEEAIGPSVHFTFITDT
jgi:hypothetical protein